MPTSHERGIIHILALLILLAGVIAGVYLITNGKPLKLFSRAASGPISSPITPTPSPSTSPPPKPTLSPTPKPSPNPTSNPFTSLSATLSRTSATFYFSYSGLKQHFEVDMSSSPSFSFDVYYKFANGTKSPLRITNPAKMRTYKCGATMYWRVRVIYQSKDAASSPIQAAKVKC